MVTQKDKILDAIAELEEENAKLRIEVERLKTAIRTRWYSTPDVEIRLAAKPKNRRKK